ncbi:MAG: PfkB family carbohydrate kinase, partial [Anaerolineales bacterium]|nr:PfkB family carbohydrate kinase [Anaerolineales bacterium]
MSLKLNASFLMLGEAVIDFISSDFVSSLEEASSFDKFSGGEVSNLAMNLSNLGFNTSLGACIGDDGFGKF